MADLSKLILPNGSEYNLKDSRVPAGAVYTDTIPSAYCDTAASTAAKTAICTDYTLTANTYTHVLIKNANSASSALTLSINGKTAKPIYINGTTSSSSNKTLPAGTYVVYYDGTNYYFRTDGKLPGNNDTTYSLSMSGNVITLTGSSGSPSSITLPVYNGSVT